MSEYPSCHVMFSVNEAWLLNITNQKHYFTIISTANFKHFCLSFFNFQNCLGLIYTVYIDSIDVPIETVVGNILAHIQVPPPGGPQVRCI